MKLSVIIPTCHRNDLLTKCLECLAPGAQTLVPGEYEVIVTDDGRRETAEPLVRGRFSWARWVGGPGRGPAANRNHGASKATGEWLAFVDDDCLPDSGWLEAIRDAALAGWQVVEGKTITPDKVDNPFRQGVENLHGDVYWSCNLAIERMQFVRLGGFDEDFKEAAGEDMEFAFRIRRRRLRATFCPAALVRHPTRPVTLRQLLWRTFLLRWIPLYYEKTGQMVIAGRHPCAVAWFITRQRTMELLRTSWHMLSRFDPGSWRTRLFYQTVKWITFPMVLPCLVYWGLRFRKQS